MACKGVNRAVFLTRFVLKNNLRCVHRFFCKMDRTVRMEIFITVSFSFLPRPIINYLKFPNDN